MSYSLRVITPPTAEPVSLAELRSQARIDSGIDDPTLAGYLMAGRQWIESVTGRCMALQTLEVTLDEFPPGAIVLPRGPVSSVVSITYTDGNGSPQTLATYTLEGQRLAPAYGESWPATRATMGAVRVQFVAGEAQPPEPMRHALLLMAAHWNENREAPPANPAVDALLAPYTLNFF